ncbi:MAG: glycoside hydrolase family 95-like protein [Bacteroidota bacterium]
MIFPPSRGILFLTYPGICILVLSLFYSLCAEGQPISPHDLHFTTLPARWDEGVPLGNGMLGAIIWQKDSSLRIAIDRADLWDLRPVKEFALPQFSFSWVREQLAKNRYDSVQQLFDLPYERDAGPSKIPAGALVIPLAGMGMVESMHLYLHEALCEIKWNSGARLLVFVDANRNTGWYKFEHTPVSAEIKLDILSFARKDSSGTGNSVGGQELARLGYPAPLVRSADPGYLYYRQQGLGESGFAVMVRIKNVRGGDVEGSWQIRNSNEGDEISYESMKEEPGLTDFDSVFRLHRLWWESFWNKSSVRLPDTLLENQYYRDLYKFGSASRKGAPPITLQAVWTADNGKLPPWKGDFHNDLNTQLSYWPGYTSNHTVESQVFTDWIWRHRDVAEKYTRNYFHCEGLNFPGVSTLAGEPMGGWIQYALSPTVSCWLAQHFYLQWKYTMDGDFLQNQAYPFISGAAAFIDALSVRNGKYRKLPISSSPEFNDNSPGAWFPETTNYDLSLIRWVYRSAYELAKRLDKGGEARCWKKCLSAWPGLSLSDSGSLLVAPGYPYKESHRHFSHLMSIYPLELINWDDGAKEQKIIQASLRDLLHQGADYWCGYSYAWLGNLQAHARNGEGACEALRTFAGCFCLSNSFHANGDQSGTGKSKFTYRPFTLEGNFAFASGIQEMLLQGNSGQVVVFPAIPASWKNVAFTNLRTQGAFLVSAVREEGKIIEIKVVCEKGGILTLVNPFRKRKIAVQGTNRVRFDRKGRIVISTSPGQQIIFKPLVK